MQFSFGSGILWGVRTDVVPNQPVRFGALQDVQIDFSADVKQLYGQMQLPLDVARGKQKIEGKAKVGAISAAAYNTLFFGGTITKGQNQVSYSEPMMVPAASPYTATVQNAATFVQDLGLRYASTGAPLIVVTGTPTAAGQYSCINGVYTFDAADEGMALLADYEYTSATLGQTITGGNPLMGAAPRFGATFTNMYEGNSLTLTLYSCVSTKLSIPTKIDDYTITELDFSAYANAAGQTFQLSTTQS